MHTREHARLLMEDDDDDILLPSFAIRDDDFELEQLLSLSTDGVDEEKPIVREEMKKSTSSRIHCGYCSKIFKTKWTLHSHLAAHEGKFQFHCDICGKRFVRKCHYDGHARTHNQERPYVCDVCGKTFKELKHRKEHAKRKHPENN